MRDRRTEQIETSVTLATVEGLPLPARVLNVFFDADDWLGIECKGRTAPYDCTRRDHGIGRPALRESCSMSIWQSWSAAVFRVID